MKIKSILKESFSLGHKTEKTAVQEKKFINIDDE